MRALIVDRAACAKMRQNAARILWRTQQNMPGRGKSLLATVLKKKRKIKLYYKPYFLCDRPIYAPAPRRREVNWPGIN
jgi:hypothetical protein